MVSDSLEKINKKNYMQKFTNVLNTNDRFKDRSFCTNIHFLVVQDGRFSYTSTYWFSAGDPHWWPMNLVPIDKVKNNGLDDFFDKGDILMLPRKIN